MAKRRNFSPDFKARVALAAIRGDSTQAELAQHYKLHPNVITKWKKQALAALKSGFQRGAQQGDINRDTEIHNLQAKIGELVVERDFLAKAFER